MSFGSWWKMYTICRHRLGRFIRVFKGIFTWDLLYSAKLMIVINERYH